MVPLCVIQRINWLCVLRICLSFCNSKRVGGDRNARNSPLKTLLSLFAAKYRYTSST